MTGSVGRVAMSGEVLTGSFSSSMCAAMRGSVFFMYFTSFSISEIFDRADKSWPLISSNSVEDELSWFCFRFPLPTVSDSCPSPKMLPLLSVVLHCKSK